MEMATAYHSVISTVKLHAISFCYFPGDFFKKFSVDAVIF